MPFSEPCVTRDVIGAPTLSIGLIARISAAARYKDEIKPRQTGCYASAKTSSLIPPRPPAQAPPAGVTGASPAVIESETFCKIRDFHDRQGLTIAQTARAWVSTQNGRHVAEAFAFRAAAVSGTR